MNKRYSFVTAGIVVVLAGMLVSGTGCGKSGTSEGVKAPSAASKPAQADGTPAPVAEEPARDPATVLVSVGEAKLTLGEVDKQLAPMMAQMGSDPRMGAMKGRFYQQAAERFVARTLLTQEADRRKVSVVESDVTEAMATITNRLPAGVTLEAALAREGLTPDKFRKNLEEELRIKKLVESEVPTNAAVSDKEIAEFYEQQKERFTAPETASARHILIKTDKEAGDQAKAEKKAKADALRKQLVEGADFAKLAQENSDCPSKERGGDLGSFGRGQMVKPFEDAAFSQATNAIGPVIETEFGYHIVQVTDRKSAGTTSLEEVKPRLTEYLKQKKQMEAFEVLLGGLKSKATIVYDDSVKPQPAMAPVPGMAE